MGGRRALCRKMQLTPAHLSWCLTNLDTFYFFQRGEWGGVDPTWWVVWRGVYKELQASLCTQLVGRSAHKRSSPFHLSCSGALLKISLEFLRSGEGRLPDPVHQFWFSLLSGTWLCKKCWFHAVDFCFSSLSELNIVFRSEISLEIHCLCLISSLVW